MMGEEWITRDSGEREDFETGSRRDVRSGKGRFDLIWPGMLVRLAGLMERGAQKYGERNWEKGQPVMRSYDSLIRHAVEWANGDVDEDHLAAVIFNAMSIMYVLQGVGEGRLSPDLDDRAKREER